MRLTKKILQGIIQANQLVVAHAKAYADDDLMTDIQKGSDWAAKELARRDGLKKKRKPAESVVSAPVADSPVEQTTTA